MQYSLGLRVEFSKAYPLDAGERFRRTSEISFDAEEATPHMGAGEGVVVGLRTFPMSDYHYRWNMDRGGSSQAKHESCWLIAYDLYRKPVIVRKCDATFIGEEDF
jgi:hypothetical protein